MNTNSQVFYRKWRPRQFSEVVGQEHVVTILKKAILTERVAHAYLFAGPRGVGKTSTARILAKTLNCLNRVDGEADNQCEHCKAVEKNSMLDLVEVDAASNRGIDSIRGLRESTTFQPVAGLWKIYIIDEVHMLTEEAFNALLKTLEEPPSSIVLILATTDAHKVPATIISRCQRFDFQRLTHEVVKARLEELCKTEKISCTPAAMAMIVNSAWGSLRDAENTLEQLALSQTGDEITEQDAAKLLGLGNRQAAIELSKALIDKDINSALATIHAEVERGISPHAIQKGTIEVLRSALLMEAGVQRLFEGDPQMVELSNSIKAADAKRRLSQIFGILGTIKFKGEMLPSVPLELAVFRICVAPEPAPVQTTPKQAPSATAKSYPKPPVAKPQATQPSVVRQTPTQSPSPPTLPATEPQRKLQELCDIIRRPPNNQARLASILNNVEPPQPSKGILYLRFKRKALHQKFQSEMNTSGVGQMLRAAVDTVYGSGLNMKARFGNESDDSTSKPSSENTPTQVESSQTVRHLVSMGAKVLAREQLPKEPKED